MHIICSITRRGWIYAEKVQYDFAELAESIFNHDYSSKTGFKYLMCSPYSQPPSAASSKVNPVRLTVPAKFSPSLVEGVMNAIGKLKQISDNYDLSDYIISHFDTFWEKKEQGDIYCGAFFETFLQSVSNIKRSIHGMPAAIAVMNDEVINLNNVGHCEQVGANYKIYVHDRYCEDEKVKKKVIKSIRQLVDAEDNEAREHASAG